MDNVALDANKFIDYLNNQPTHTWSGEARGYKKCIQEYKKLSKEIKAKLLEHGVYEKSLGPKHKVTKIAKTELDAMQKIQQKKMKVILRLGKLLEKK
jgi:hypothetical protein